MWLRSLCCSLVLLSVLAGDSVLFDAHQAQAQQVRLVIQQPRTDRQIELNIHGMATYGFGWYDGLYGDYGPVWGDYATGLGAQLLFPIVKNVISSLNNPMYLGFFTDFLFIPSSIDGFDNYLFSFAIGPVLQWRFVILDMFRSGGLSAFTNVGFGLWPWFTRGEYGPGTSSVVFYGFPLFELGANLMFTRLVGITLSFGYPSVKFGLNLAF
jgi:hypothetical protein